jgi:hypothetical protein
MASTTDCRICACKLMPEALSNVMIKCSFTIATILSVTAARTKTAKAKTACTKPASQTDSGH